MAGIRVAHLTATFPPYWGGTGTVAFHQAQELARRGHTVTVLTGSAGSADDNPEGVAVRRLTPKFAIGNAPFIPGLAGMLGGYDVIHFHHPFIFGTEAALAARLRTRRTALVVTHHNRLIGNGLRRPLFFGYEETAVRALVRVADRVCVVSRDHAESVGYLQSGMRRTPERFAETPNGVDTGRFSPGDGGRTRSELGIGPDAPVVVVVAALDRAHHFKRVDLAIDAVARLADIGAHLLVVGGGELLGDLRGRASASGAADRVHFTGARPHSDLAQLLRAADAGLLPSDPPESFGLVLIEEMACGLPVVATDYPGARAVVAPEAGSIARRGDADDIARKLRSLLTAGGAERERRARAARAHVERHFDWAAVVERLERVYDEALAKRR